MRSLRHGSPSLSQSLRGALAICGLLPLVGCQAEYAGMNLPSMHYLNDDVQYFAPGPHFPWANTQAATQRARMEAMGVPIPEDSDVGSAGASGKGADALMGPNSVPSGPGGDANSMLPPNDAGSAKPSEPAPGNDANALTPNPVSPVKPDAGGTPPAGNDDSVPPPAGNNAGAPAENARAKDNSPF